MYAACESFFCLVFYNLYNYYYCTFQYYYWYFITTFVDATVVLKAVRSTTAQIWYLLDVRGDMLQVVAARTWCFFPPKKMKRKNYFRKCFIIFLFTLPKFPTQKNDRRDDDYFSRGQTFLARFSFFPLIFRPYSFFFRVEHAMPQRWSMRPHSESTKDFTIIMMGSHIYIQQ